MLLRNSFLAEGSIVSDKSNFRTFKLSGTQDLPTKTLVFNWILHWVPIASFYKNIDLVPCSTADTYNKATIASLGHSKSSNTKDVEPQCSSYWPMEQFDNKFQTIVMKGQRYEWALRPIFIITYRVPSKFGTGLTWNRKPQLFRSSSGSLQTTWNRHEIVDF